MYNTYESTHLLELYCVKGNNKHFYSTNQQDCFLPYLLHVGVILED